MCSWTTCSSGRCSCPWQEGWNEMVFKDLLNLTFLSFCRPCPWGVPARTHPFTLWFPAPQIIWRRGMYRHTVKGQKNHLKATLSCKRNNCIHYHTEMKSKSAFKHQIQEWQRSLARRKSWDYLAGFAWATAEASRRAAGPDSLRLPMKSTFYLLNQNTKIQQRSPNFVCNRKQLKQLLFL